jgi:DNA-binding MarR family transcriptional regulator
MPAKPSLQTCALLDEFQLENIVSHLLRRAHFSAEEQFSKQFANIGLTPRQKALLVIVYKNSGLSQNAAAEQLHMDRNTVAEMVRRLDALQWITCTPDPNDKRAKRLMLAPKGAQILDVVMADDLVLDAKLLERLPQEYRSIFVKCLRMLVAI